MITKIELTNFKSHAHTVIEPGRVTALVGPNGAGKSSVLQAVASFLELLTQNVENTFGLDNNIYEYSRRGSGGFEILLNGVSTASSWHLSFFHNWDIANHFASAMLIDADYPERGLAWSINSQTEEVVDFLITDRITDKIDSEYSSLSYSKLVNEIGEPFYLKANYADLASPTDESKISSTGKGLASVIANQKTEFDERHKTLEELLCSVIPQVKNIKARRAEIVREETETIRYEEAVIPVRRKRTVSGHELVFDTIGGEKIPARFMSEGTILTLGILTALTLNPRCKVFLIDDIEAGLHPLAQRQLMQVLKDFAEKHDRQIILTSHSPYIVDALDAKDVWVMATDKEGISHSKRLSDHPDAKRAIDILTTGELWDAEGESWVLEDTPAETVNA